MARVIVRNLDDRIVAALKEQAKRHGRSLEQELRQILAGAVRPSRADALRVADEIRRSAPPQRTDSTDLIREDRDRR